MNAHLTARARTRLSAPVKFLKEHGLLKGRVLDYGCGRGFDCDSLKVEGFDPFFRPAFPSGKFDTIFCVYVLNVIESPCERELTVKSVTNLLNPGGTAYFAVRNDKKLLKGLTSRGTWQGLVTMSLPVVKANNGYVIYEMKKSV